MSEETIAQETAVTDKVIICIGGQDIIRSMADYQLTMESTEEQILNRLEVPIREELGAEIKDDDNWLYKVRKATASRNIYLIPNSTAGVKPGLCEFVCILDRSGSMSTTIKDAIGGINTLLEAQTAEDPDRRFTVIMFDDKYEIPYDGVKVKDIKKFTDKTYVPRGQTALLDAIGKTINTVGERLMKTPEDERPERVVFAILTDGEENHSHEFTNDKIKEMIEHQTNTYKWAFMYLGANQDAFAVARTYGISMGNTMTLEAGAKGIVSGYTMMTRSLHYVANCATPDMANIVANANSGIDNTSAK